jgi:hypothetical protein
VKPIPIAALIVLAGCLVSSRAVAADWNEPPYNPPVGSRWIVERDLTKEEEDSNGRVVKSTFKITSELKIEGKTATGFRFMYARRKASYDCDDAERQAQMRIVLPSLMNIEYHGEMDASGKPLRIDNIDQIKAALGTMIDKLVNTSPGNATLIRQTLAPMLDLDAASAAALYMDQLPNLALAQSTGLKPGETRRDSYTEQTSFGAPLVIDRALSIKAFDAEKGTVEYEMSSAYDEAAIKAFLGVVLARIGRAGADVTEPESNTRQTSFKMDEKVEFDVSGGMTRQTDSRSTLTVDLAGAHRVTTDHKVTTVSPAP